MNARVHAEIRLLRAAEEDLSEIMNYIAADSMYHAERTLLSLEDQFTQLSRFPEMGTLPDDTHLLALGYRVLVSGKYLLFYKIEQEAVIIYRILHTSRDARAILFGDATGR